MVGFTERTTSSPSFSSTHSPPPSHPCTGWRRLRGAIPCSSATVLSARSCKRTLFANRAARTTGFALAKALGPAAVAVPVALLGGGVALGSGKLLASSTSLDLHPRTLADAVPIDPPSAAQLRPLGGLAPSLLGLASAPVSTAFEMLGYVTAGAIGLVSVGAAVWRLRRRIARQRGMRRVYASRFEDGRQPTVLIVGVSAPSSPDAPLSIGAATALQFAERGYRVVATSTSAEGVERIRDWLAARPDSSLAIEPIELRLGAPSKAGDRQEAISEAIASIANQQGVESPELELDGVVIAAGLDEPRNSRGRLRVADQRLEGTDNGRAVGLWQQREQGAELGGVSHRGARAMPLKIGDRTDVDARPFVGRRRARL